MKSDETGRPARRILLLTPVAPTPPSWGFVIRVHHLAMGLARHHQVTLVSYGAPGDNRDWAAMEESFAAVHRVPSPVAGSRRRAQMAHLLRTSSFHLGGLWSHDLQMTLDRLLSTEDFDLIQVESSQMGSFHFPAELPVILDEHNLEYQVLSRVAATETSPLRRLYGNVEAMKARRDEHRTWTRMAGCVATSELDAHAIRAECPDLPVAIVPNAVDISYFAPARATATVPGSLVFVGRLDYRPNTEAVRWFITEVLPRLRRVQPSTHLTVVGDGAPAWLEAMSSGPGKGDLGGSGGVTVTGQVPDVRPYVAAAQVVVAPLRAGGGTRLKLLEAMAMAKPIVSTRLGAEGLDVEEGEQMDLADDPEQMTEAILRLFREPDRRRRLGRAGRALVEERYGWAPALATLEAFHDQVLAPAPALTASVTQLLGSPALRQS